MGSVHPFSYPPAYQQKKKGSLLVVNWRTVAATIAAIFVAKYIGRKIVPSVKPFTENI